jgi:serine/threonine protein kinase
MQMGAVVASRFRIEGVLGRGGSGITYRALDLTLNRTIALKELFPSGAVRVREFVHPGSINAGAFRDARERVVFEARLLAQFDSPSIVRVYDIIESAGTAYVVMELLEAPTLAERLGTVGTLSEAETGSIVLQVCTGLTEVHEAGLLHRDIKPANIVLHPERGPVLIDFGAARVVDGERSVSLTQVMTPRYAAPEQFQQRGRFGPWTDLYGLAATAFRCVTGSLPPDVIDRSQGADLDELDKYCSLEFSSAIRKGLELTGSARPPSAAHFANLLPYARLGKSSLAATEPPPLSPNETDPTVLRTATPSDVVGLFQGEETKGREFSDAQTVVSSPDTPGSNFSKPLPKNSDGRRRSHPRRSKLLLVVSFGIAALLLGLFVASRGGNDSRARIAASPVTETASSPVSSVVMTASPTQGTISPSNQTAANCDNPAFSSPFALENGREAAELLSALATLSDFSQSEVASLASDIASDIDRLEPPPRTTLESFGRIDYLKPKARVQSLDESFLRSCGRPFFANPERALSLTPRAGSEANVAHVGETLWDLKCVKVGFVEIFSIAFVCPTDIEIFDLRTGILKIASTEVPRGEWYGLVNTGARIAWLETTTVPAKGLDPELSSVEMRIVDLASGNMHRALVAEKVAENRGARSSASTGPLLDNISIAYAVGLRFITDVVDNQGISHLQLWNENAEKLGPDLARGSPSYPEIKPIGPSLISFNIADNGRGRGVSANLARHPKEIKFNEIGLSVVSKGPCPRYLLETRDYRRSLISYRKDANLVERLLEHGQGGVFILSDNWYLGLESFFGNDKGNQGVGVLDVTNTQVWKIPAGVPKSWALFGSWLMVTNQSDEKLIIDGLTGQPATGLSDNLKLALNAWNDGATVIRTDLSFDSIITQQENSDAYRVVGMDELCRLTTEPAT